MAETLELPRSPPLIVRSSLSAWLRTNLFANWTNAILTVLLAYAVWLLATKFLGWAVFNAVWSSPPGDSSVCRAMRGQGACWALIGEKHRFMLFATYPYDEHWRPALSCLIMIALYVISAIRRFWTRALLLYWVAGLVVSATLMWGGIFGLPYVSQQLWGGLPVTLLLATFGIASALPLGIILALGRQTHGLPVIRALCIGYIEVIRGVPLVSLLFMASFLLPLFMPGGISVDKLLRAQIAFTMFASAYLAEVVRGGLQGVQRGQYDAADALGLGYWTSHWFIILPQALRSVIPSLVNTSISMFKSTSLVLIIGLFDLLNAGKATIVDPLWQAFGLEMFIAISLVYFVFCFSMSKYSQHIEARLQGGRKS
jgi:general L-amino acid transport system permease protein